MAGQRETDPNEAANDVAVIVSEFLDELLFPASIDLPMSQTEIVDLVAVGMARTELTRKAVTVAAIKWAEAKERSASRVKVARVIPNRRPQ